MATNPSGTFTITSSKTYTATDNAGNSNSCSVTVTSSVATYTRNRYSCTTGTYSLYSSGYVQSCTAKSKADADAANSGNYTLCYTRSDSLCESNGLSSGCYYRYYYTRSGCSAYSSTVGYTSTVTSCSESSSSYYKYTCTAKSYTYSGSA